MAKGKGLGGLILGAIIGAAVALLWSPKRGQEWRDELKDKGEKLKDGAANLGAKVNTTAETVSAPNADLIDAVKTKGAEWIGEAGEHLKDLKNSAAQKIGEVKQESSGGARVVSAQVSEAEDEL